MRRFACIGAFCLLLFSSSCLEEFIPEIDEATDSIVVEGNILQGKHGATVRLSQSFTIGTRRANPIEFASVGIRDDQGNESSLLHTEKGVYISDTTELQGLPGRSYQLFAQIPPGIRIESDWMLMQESAQLENMYFEFEERPGDINPVNGVQIYLDAYDPLEQTKYYRWEYEETWEFRVPYPATGTWNTQTNQPVLFSFSMRPHICWNTISSSDIHLGSIDGLVGSRIAKYPINFISTKGNRLFTKYSILVKQYSISPETHEFWRRLKNVTEDLGTLFDPVPTEVRGNIRNLDEENSQVLGFFSADGYQENRIFISRSDLPPVAIPSGFRDCVYDTVPRNEVNSNIIQGKLFVEEVLSLFGSSLGFGMTQARCADCSLTGSREKPSFWD